MEVLLPQPVRLLFGFLEFFRGDLTGLQQPPLVLLGDFQQPRVVLVTFPHRLRDEDAPQPDGVVERAGRVEHLEVELVEPFEHRGPVTFRIELGGQCDRSRAAGSGNMGRQLLGPRARRIGQPLVEVTREDLGKSGRTRIFRVEDRVFQILHPLAESEDLLPLVQRRLRLVGIGRQLQLVHFAEEPFDLREARGVVALHRPVELFLGPRFRLAGPRAEPLGHDADDQSQRLPVLFQRLLSDQFLGPANADGRIVLPVHNFEPGFPDMGRVAVVFIEELAHVLPFRPHVTGRGKEHMILTEWDWGGFHWKAEG